MSRAKRRAAPQAPKGRIEILGEIEAALREWGKFYGPGTDRALQRSEQAKAAARKAMNLMTEHRALLNRCKADYGCRPVLAEAFRCLDEAATWPADMGKGDCLAWGRIFTQRVLWEGRALSFIDEVRRWADKLEREQSSQATRRTRFDKVSAIAAYLEAHPKGTSEQVGAATGLDPSNVRHLWTPIKKALKEGRRPLPRGWKQDGQIHAVDESAYCHTCDAPLEGPWECELCQEIIRGECRTCHFTNMHPDEATP